MKKMILTTLIVCIAIMGSGLPARAQVATMDEALTVANNWITLIIHKKGDWGGSETAEVEDIQEFKRGEQVIGYFCHVKPKGYIILSLRKELAPVKAYSARSDLDPESEEGMADLLKGSMARNLDRVEQVINTDKAAGTEELSDILEIDYRNAWNELEGDVEALMEGPVRDKEVPKGELKGEEGSPEGDLESGGEESNYQEGQFLLTSSWHQNDPYNRQVPAPPSGDDCTATHCTVGCVATAGAQIMRYWNWPPYGVGSPYSDTYDWRNMPDSVTGTSLAAQINAVAELSHEVGIAVGMRYCSGTAPVSNACASSANTYNMEDVYEDHYRYSTACSRKDRSSYSAVEWFNIMKADFNANRPVQYKVPGHSIVGDGWQEIGSTPVRQYHMNYGWGNSRTTWYTLDALHLGDPDEEYMLENIYPAQVLGNFINGTYSKNSFYYRYFDRDTSGYSATFEAGQRLQFLPNIRLRCSSTLGPIRFEASNTSSTYTRLFTRGDTTRGVCMYNNANSTIKMNYNGSIKFH